MYNKETKAKESIDENHYTKHHFYPDTSRQLLVLKQNMEKCPPSWYALRETMKMVYQIENVGLLKMSLELTTKTKQKVEQLFDQGFLAYFTVKVSFNLDEPVAAGSFIQT